MAKRLFAPLAVAVVLIAAGLPEGEGFAAGDESPGAMTTTSMKERLKLTDDQVAKLEPVIETRIQKVDAALAKLDAAEEPNVLGFVEEFGAIQREFDAGVTYILAPDQLSAWQSVKSDTEKSLAQAGAKKQLVALQPALKLTDEQVTKLQPAMAAATQKKIDALQKLAGSGRISARDKLGAKRTLDGINAELEKAMSAVMSPAQLDTYKTVMEQKKKKE